MTVTLLSAHGTAATGLAATCTLPAGIPNNSYAYLVVVAQTPANIVFPTGWLLYDSAADGGGSVYLFIRPVGPADSSTVVTMSWAGSIRWNTAVLVASGENLDLTSTVNSTTLTATPAVPAITPAHNDCMDVIIGGLHGGAAGPVTATPPAGFTEDQDYSSAFGSATEQAVYIAHRQLTGQAGVLQAATTLSAVSPTSRAAMWRLALAPGSGLQRTRDNRLSAQALTFTTASRVRTGRLSTQVLIGPPQKMRVGRLSVRVLSTDPAAPPAAPRFEGWGIPI